MGTNSSKSPEDVVLSPKKNITTADNVDPRSPTPEITRTPLQGKTNAKHNITKNADLRKTFENDTGVVKLIHNNPILSAVIKSHLQSYDPRSPTQDFERTPIVLSKKDDEQDYDKNKLRLQNGSNYGSPCLKLDESGESCEEAKEDSPDLMVPKKLCDGFFDMTLNDTLKEEPLGSSTVSNEAIENDISKEVKKPTELLETNFDYVSDSEKFEDSEESIQNTSTKSEGDFKNVPYFKILEDDPRSPSVGIDRTPIVVAKGEDRVEEMSDDTLIRVLQNTNVELRQTNSKPQEQKGDGIMIYEDEPTNKPLTPNKAKSTCSSGSRTPLSCMKNKTEATHIRSKSANPLFDPKTQKTIPSRIPKRVSHIPRLKSLCKQKNIAPPVSNLCLKSISKTSAVSGDCENTPPHSHRDIWDKDNSIVL